MNGGWRMGVPGGWVSLRDAGVGWVACCASQGLLEGDRQGLDLAGFTLDIQRWHPQQCECRAESGLLSDVQLQVLWYQRPGQPSSQDVCMWCPHLLGSEL